MANTNSSITRKINSLGNYLAEIKVLEEKAKAIKADLIAAGITERFTGQYKVTIYQQERGTLDKAAVVEHCGLAWVAAHTNVNVSTVVKVTAVAQEEKVAA